MNVVETPKGKVTTIVSNICCKERCIYHRLLDISFVGFLCFKTNKLVSHILPLMVLGHEVP